MKGNGHHFLFTRKYSFVTVYPFLYQIKIQTVVKTEGVKTKVKSQNRQKYIGKREDIDKQKKGQREKEGVRKRERERGGVEGGEREREKGEGRRWDCITDNRGRRRRQDRTEGHKKNGKSGKPNKI